MLAVRTIARLTTRAAPLCRIPTARYLSTSVSRPSIFSAVRTSFRPVGKPSLVSRFSTSIARLSEEGSVDQELSAKLQHELDLEKEMKGFDDMPESIKSFLESTPFKVNDNPGHEEVELVRKYGNETIRVEFSISDLNLMNPDHLDDTSLYDDEAADIQESQSGQSKQAKDSSREEEDEYMDDEAEPEPSFPAHLSIIIEKPNGALKIAGVAQDGMLVLQNVVYHASPAMLKTKSAESDYQSEGLYAGPEFGNLDEDLQMLFERYLDERGINTALALFVPDYIEYKEQREYLRWLDNVKNFVDA